MGYISIINRSDAAALIPQEVSAEILKNVPQQSAVMQLARRLPNLSAAQRRLPVLAALATAYFVDSDTGLKQTADISTDNAADANAMRQYAVFGNCARVNVDVENMNQATVKVIGALK